MLLRQSITLASLLFLASMRPASAQSPTQISLPASVQEMLLKSNIPLSAVALWVQPADKGAPTITYGDDRAMQPASTMKVLTAAAALDVLGPVYRGRVELRSSEPVGRAQLSRASGEGESRNIQDGPLAPSNGIYNGDIYLRGLGHVDFEWETLAKLLQTLRNRGVQTINGRVVIDRNYYEPTRTDVGVPPFDDAPEFRYNVIPDALMLGSNLIQFDIESDGNMLFTTISPELERVRVINKLKLIDRNCAAWEDGWKIPIVEKAERGEISITLHGEYPRNCVQTQNLNVVDRADYADRLFRSLWRKLGGQFRGEVVEGATPAGTALVAEHRGRALPEVLRDILKRSDNPMTRMALQTIGAESTRSEARHSDGAAVSASRITSIAAGDARIRNWLRANRISDEGLVIENGSGLSRTEMIKPSQLAGVLMTMYHSKWRHEFIAAMPIAGVDGTLRSRFRNSALAENARLKTGTLKNVVSLAGYVPSVKGETLIVVAMINHDNASHAVARPIIDALVEWVASTQISR
jgi:serine-type D-Ala-D-Ala carboxypeptidase/endopeptidase (penicillin-binding protein 4)